MAPIWGRYGPFFLYGYSVVLGLGVLAALAVTAWRARRSDSRPLIHRPLGGVRGGSAIGMEVSGPLPNPLPKGEGTSSPLPDPLAGGEGTRGWLDGALAAAGGALVGGRAVYVWLNAAYFAENSTEAWRVWSGGLNYHGALLGGLAALWLWARLTRRSFPRYAALLAPGLALLVAFGWAACAVEGCAYGRAAAPGLLAGDLPDDTGVYALRYRTQIAGAVGTLVVFGLAWWAAARLRPAALFWGTLAGLALVHMAVELGRGDASPLVGGMRLGLVIEAGLLAVAGVGLWFSRRPDAQEPK